jgi:ABC-type nitrate/sulfonate/bicarbonate transport system permease component
VNIFDRVNVRKARLRLVAALSLVALWQLAAWFVAEPKLLPDFRYIFSYSLPSIAIFSGYPEGSLAGAVRTLLYHGCYTLLRVVVGLSVGTLAGLLVGLGIHFFRRSSSGQALLLSTVRTVPLFALIPLFLYWFGGQEIGIYVYISFSVFVVVATNTHDAVLNVPPAYIQQALLLGATRYQVFRTVVFYAIQPQMIASLRNVIGLCWAFSLGAEYLSARTGIGYLLYQSYLYADMGKLLVFALLYATLGVSSFVLTKRAVDSLRRWD